MKIDLFKTYNEGQYKLKPWAANLIMGILELVFVLGWFYGCIFIAFQQILNFEIVEAFDFVGITSGLVLAGLFIGWNLLVWLVKPLRTKFNYKESLWNVIFIIWTIVDIIRYAM